MTLEYWLCQSSLPKLEARMLLEHIGYTHVQLITQGDRILDAQQQERLASLQNRRLSGEPMAYILGKREFYGRMFAVNPNVLIPRPETEHLVEAVLECLPRNGRVWDLGTGSGAIAITLKLERPKLQVRASDISEGAIATAKHNAQLLGASIEFGQGSWFNVAMPSEPHSYDVIVSNPPYIEKNDVHLSQGDLRFEPQNALTDFSDGLSCIRVLAQEAPNYLKNGGWLLIEHGYDQGQAAREIFLANGFCEVATLQDWAGLDRITLGKIDKI